MRWFDAKSHLVAAVFLGCVASSCGSMGAPGQPGDATPPLKQGEWGGQHIDMTVSASKTDIEFDCGKATVTGTIATDAAGAFTANGVFTPEPQGPTTPDPPPTRPLRMTGTVNADAMQARIVLTDQNEDLGSFSLTFGAAARLVKCR